MTIELEIQIASEEQTLPHPSQFREWVSAALWNQIDEAELTIRIVDEEEITILNEQFRNKNKPTNVLSFPFDPPPEVDIPLLGDIVICAAVVNAEAKSLKKTMLAHWAHIVIHGTLHLLNYTHDDEITAEEMEGLETEVMVNLGYPPPYGDTFIS